MASKSKTSSAKGKAVKPIPKNQKSQSERFIETARSLVVDETGKEFDRAFKKLLPSKPQKR